MNNSLRKLVQKSNLQTKSDFEVIETPSFINGGIYRGDKGCDGDLACGIVVIVSVDSGCNGSCNTSCNSGCGG
jgi:hypothetical protein